MEEKLPQKCSGVSHVRLSCVTHTISSLGISIFRETVLSGDEEVIFAFPVLTLFADTRNDPDYFYGDPGEKNINLIKHIAKKGNPFEEKTNASDT